MLDDKSPWFKGFCSVKEKKVKTIKEFQEVIGYEFENESLLRQALTHSSYANEKHMKKLSDNERLEFLGDAVLEAVSSEFLFLNYRLCRKEILRDFVQVWSVNRLLPMYKRDRSGILYLSGQRRGHDGAGPANRSCQMPWRQ